MSETKMLEILERIRVCIYRNDLYVVKKYVQLEIENLTGATEQNCQNTKYYYYDSYCKEYRNNNCSKKLEMI